MPRKGIGFGTVSLQPSGLVLYEDWLDCNSQADLSAKEWFYQYGSQTDPCSAQCMDAVLVTGETTHDHVVRIRLNPTGMGCQRTVYTWHWFGPEVMDVTLPRLWFKFRLRFLPPWTVYHEGEPGDPAPSYKLSYIQITGAQSRIQYDYTALHVANPWGWAGSPEATEWSSNASPGDWWNLGYTLGEWSDEEWHEFVQYMDITAYPTVRLGWFRRQLTQNLAIDAGPWVYLTHRYENVSSASNAYGVGIGQNFNKDPDYQMYHYIGPVEVIDASANPDPYNLATYLV